MILTYYKNNYYQKKHGQYCVIGFPIKSDESISTDGGGHKSKYPVSDSLASKIEQQGREVKV